MPLHAISWFEIAVTDLDRAAAFYGAILDTTLDRMELGSPAAVFPADQENGVGGALILDGTEPSENGALVYLETEGRLQEVLDRVEGAGGEVVLGFTEIGSGYGDYALIKDTEGNRVGLFQSP